MPRRRSREELIAALRAWNETMILPRSPRVEAYDRYVERHPEVPHRSEFYREFGGFREACKAAGFSILPVGRSPQVTSQKAVKTSLLRAKEELGDAITYDAYRRWAQEKNRDGVKVATINCVQRFYGSWTEAALDAGIKTHRKRRWSRTPEEMTPPVREVCEAYGGRPVNCKEFEAYGAGNPNIPPLNAVRQTFGGFRQALNAAGYPPPPPKSARKIKGKKSKAKVKARAGKSSKGKAQVTRDASTKRPAKGKPKAKRAGSKRAVSAKKSSRLALATA